MGKILDSILCYKDSLTGSAFETMSVASGDSLSLRFFGPGTSAKLLDTWGANNATLCDFSIRSPLLHDNVRGIRFAHMFNPTASGADGNPQLYLPPTWTQPLVPTDTLIAEVLGTASDDVTFAMSLEYEGPQVPNGRFATVEEVTSRRVNLVGIRVVPVPAASTSTWGAAYAIDTTDNRLKANTDYALLGATADLPVTALKFWGPDTANFACAFPGSWQENKSAGWFYDMAHTYRGAYIPVINSNNKGVTYVAAAQVGGGSSPNIDLLFAQLA